MSTDFQTIVSTFREVGTVAVIAMMAKIRRHQTNPRGDLESLVKDNETLVTIMDRLSAEAGREILHSGMPQMPERDEELGDSAGAGEYEWVVYKDPLDGTKVFVFRAGTETVILGLRHRPTNRIVAAIVGHPATGRIWFTAVDQPTTVTYTQAAGGAIAEECHVWHGPKEKGTLLIDLIGPFEQAWTREGMAEFAYELVRNGVDFASFGSNGLHTALAADQGNEPKGVMATLTAALGGPWDAAFALGVINAGGAAVGLKIIFEDGQRQLMRCDPLQPEKFNMLLTANSLATLQYILDLIRLCFQ